MGLELASDEGNEKRGGKKEENCCNRWVGKHFRMGRRGEKRKRICKSSKKKWERRKMEMEGTFVSRERTGEMGGSKTRSAKMELGTLYSAWQKIYFSRWLRVSRNHIKIIMLIRVQYTVANVV